MPTKWNKENRKGAKERRQTNEMYIKATKKIFEKKEQGTVVFSGLFYYYCNAKYKPVLICFFLFICLLWGKFSLLIAAVSSHQCYLENHHSRFTFWMVAHERFKAGQNVWKAMKKKKNNNNWRISFRLLENFKNNPILSHCEKAFYRLNVIQKLWTWASYLHRCLLFNIHVYLPL